MKGMHAAHTQHMDGAMKKDSAITRTASARHTCNTYIYGLAWDAHGICTTRTWHGHTFCRYSETIKALYHHDKA